jgi:endo-1,4-beta-xylanase
MLQRGVPNLEMHIYGRGTHGGGLKARGGIPLGTWPDRFIDWFRDLGFLEKPGVETKAAAESAAFAAKPAS